MSKSLSRAILLARSETVRFFFDLLLISLVFFNEAAVLFAHGIPFSLFLPSGVVGSDPISRALFLSIALGIFALTVAVLSKNRVQHSGT